MHGFLSRDGMPPAELLAAGRDEVRGYGGEIVEGTVSGSGARRPSGFRVLLADGQRVSARRLLVATGLRDELPDIPGLRERWARDVLHCPYCHGYEVRDQQLGVLGGAPAAVRYAQIVRQWSDDVVFFAPPGTLTAAERAAADGRAIGIVEGDVGSGSWSRTTACAASQMDDGRTVPRDALFVPPRFVPNNDLLVGLGCDLDADGWVGHRRHRPDQRPRRVGGRQRRRTHAPRSSPPPAKGPRPPSPSTPTWSTKTSATPSTTSHAPARPQT